MPRRCCRDVNLHCFAACSASGAIQLGESLATAWHNELAAASPNDVQAAFTCHDKVLACRWRVSCCVGIGVSFTCRIVDCDTVTMRVSPKFGLEAVFGQMIPALFNEWPQKGDLLLFLQRLL